MADVRLTATNPEDSSVVPVACDAAGRLLLEEPQVIEGPPGPPGEQGPPGQDGQDGQDGDPFSGDFADNVTFGGTATFDGELTVGGNALSGTAAGTKLFTDGFVAATAVSGAVWRGYALNNPNATSAINFDGSASFAGVIRSGSGESITSPKTPCSYIQDSGGVFTYRSDANRTASVFEGGVANGTNAPQRNVILNATGSASFAGNKAGFTAEGYLWCTTERGDTVYLQGTSQGVGIWAEYTPNTRLEEIRDKLDANRGETGEMPADTQ